MKYYINKKYDRLLVDPNEHTSYLKDRGYEEITKEEYNRISLEHLERDEENDND